VHGDLGERHEARRAGEVAFRDLLDDELAGLRLGARVAEPARREPDSAAGLGPRLQQPRVALAAATRESVRHQRKRLVQTAQVGAHARVEEVQDQQVRRRRRAAGRVPQLVDALLRADRAALRAVDADEADRRHRARLRVAALLRGGQARTRGGGGLHGIDGGEVEGEPAELPGPHRGC
jgi:hypothetical protein